MEAKRKSRRIDDNGSIPFKCFLQPVDHHAFVIGLPEIALRARLVSKRKRALLHLTSVVVP